jgi:hypothetical protein
VPSYVINIVPSNDTFRTDSRAYEYSVLLSFKYLFVIPLGFPIDLEGLPSSEVPFRPPGYNTARTGTLEKNLIAKPFHTD